MAHVGTKGYYVKKLKEAGITHHPETNKSLKLYKAHELASLLESTKA